MTRVTHLMTSRGVLTGIQDASGRLARTQDKLSTGKEILRPSDDPLATNRALALRGEVESLRQYQTNVSDGQAWQTVADVAMQKINDYSARARELLVQGASDSMSSQGREAIAAEIDQLTEAVKQEANATYGGRYVFGGTVTSAPPYSVGGADAYGGNRETFARSIGPGVSLPVNTIGADVLGGEKPDDGLLLDVLRGIAEHLRSVDPADAELLRTGDFAALDRNVDSLLGIRAQVGARMNRLDVAAGRLAEMEENAGRLLSEAEDADMAKTMVDFSMQQAVYQSALKTGAHIVQASLLDFLR